MEKIAQSEILEYVYNAVVWTVKNHGFGLSKEMISGHALEAAHKLVSEGRLKCLQMDYGPVFCLTKGYCLEENLSDGSMEALLRIPLIFFRFYMGHETLLPQPGDQREGFKKSALKDAYDEWLIKNKGKLEELETLEYNDKYESNPNKNSNLCAPHQ